MQKRWQNRDGLKDEEIHPIDVHVGKRLRLRRLALGYSQQTLAKMMDLTFQQIQKYEKGTNRISASRLYEVSLVLRTSPNFFFKDAPIEIYGKEFACSKDADLEFIKTDPMQTEEALRLVGAYYNIVNRQIAQGFLSLIERVSRSNSIMSKDKDREARCCERSKTRQKLTGAP